LNLQKHVRTTTLITVLNIGQQKSIKMKEKADLRVGLSLIQEGFLSGFRTLILSF